MTERAKLELFVVTETQNGSVLERLVSLTLNAGDVLVMRGDTVHAGSGYVRGHFGRLHAYLDHPSVKRCPNTTDRHLPHLVPNPVAKPPDGGRRRTGTHAKSKGTAAASRAKTKR